MNTKELLRSAFNDLNFWMPYYNLFNSLFTESRTKVIHDAKTASVAMTCINLHSTYGFSYDRLFKDALELFVMKGRPNLSEIVSLSSCASFELSLQALKKKCSIADLPGSAELTSTENDNATSSIPALDILDPQLPIKFQMSTINATL